MVCMNNYWKRICLILFLLFSFIFTSGVKAIEYQKIEIGSSKDICISYSAWWPAKTANSSMFSKCSNDAGTAVVYNEGSECGEGSKFTGSPTAGNKIKCSTKPGTYCVPQQFNNLYGGTMLASIFSDSTCEILKEGEVVKTKEYCCDCSKKGGSIETVSVDEAATPKCSCSATPEPGECNKVLFNLKVKAGETLNKAQFNTGKKGVIQIIGKVTNFLLFPIGAIMMALYIWAGFLWMTAQGNSENISKAKAILVWTTLGIVATLSSYLIVQFVFKNILQI
jgi:hypothetical protein